MLVRKGDQLQGRNLGDLTMKGVRRVELDL